MFIVTIYFFDMRLRKWYKRHLSLLLPDSGLSALLFPLDSLPILLFTEGAEQTTAPNNLLEITVSWTAIS
ncbi:MAG: hypothetical protein ACTFAL_13820 [Candidatus Electronema sp. V4]|uniref:hypothetical protein n=1 Tax=Candidatus Electronema sp. V4 TaxID=3454756 RepID=UPI0040557809